MRILIIGTVATGKTTLAKKLSLKHKINFYEIDSIVHNDNKNGEKRTIEEQENIIKEIINQENWIIEGVLRKNLEYLLELADRIIYMDISKNKRNIRIAIRYIKQKLKLEKANYKPSIQTLKLMYKWSNNDELKKREFEKLIEQYKEKIETIKK